MTAADRIAERKLIDALNRKAVILANPGKFDPAVLRMVERQIARHTAAASVELPW